MLDLDTRYGRRLRYRWRPLVNWIKLKWSARPRMRVFLVTKYDDILKHATYVTIYYFACRSSCEVL